MAPRPKPTRRQPQSPFPEAGLASLGIARGDTVRFRRRDNERWTLATVVRREHDGSVGLSDRRGAARSLPVDTIEVRTVGPRGGTRWEPLTERAARTEQMRLL